MTAIETLERAIARLEELRDKATPGEWWATRDMEWPSVFAGTGSSVDVMVASDCRLPGDAALIVALSRTVEPMLSVLRGAVEEWRDYEEMAEESGLSPAHHQSVIVAGAVLLARAILGEERS